MSLDKKDRARDSIAGMKKPKRLLGLRAKYSVLTNDSLVPAPP